MNEKVDFKIIFKDGKKWIKLKHTPKSSMPWGLVVFTEKDISDTTTNQCKCDLIAGQKVYPYPDIGDDNSIKEIFITRLISKHE